MKQDPYLAMVEQQMKLGVITKEGFLGTDTRSLTEILATDEADVNRLNLSHQEIADELRHLLEKGKSGLGTEVTVDGKYLVTVDSVRGKLPCPWLRDGLFAKTNVRAKKISTGEEILFTDLNLHLIEAHGFYQGRGSYFRHDPAMLKRFLDL